MIPFTVINPSIRMSWIHKHWDQEYVLKAQESIKELVRQFFQNSGLNCLTYTQDAELS